MNARGFSLIELLIALTVCALISGAVAATVPPSRAAFEHTPAVLDLHQRTRTALESIAQAVRGAFSVTLHGAGPGVAASRLQTIARAPAAAEAALASDQVDVWAPLVLSDTGCPAIADACGFRAGATAIIADGSGRSEVFVVAAADAASRTMNSQMPLSQPYTSGASVREVDAYTFRLVTQANGMATLTRDTAAGAVQPMVDGVSELAFAWRSPRELEVRLRVEPPSGPPGLRAITAQLVVFTRNAS